MKEQWEYNILRCINSLGGEACLSDIYDEIGKFVDLTEEHRRYNHRYKEPAYHIQIRKHVRNLYQKDELEWVSKGCYSLIKKGQEKLMREKPIKDAEEI